jgi:hypothetical protein
VFLSRVSPALEEVDSSSGSVRTATRDHDISVVLAERDAEFRVDRAAASAAAREGHFPAEAATQAVGRAGSS